MFRRISKKRINIFAILIAIACCFYYAPKSKAAILFEDNFDGYLDSPENHGWNVPNTVSMASCDSPDGGRCAMVTCLITGTQYSFDHDPNPSGIFADGHVGFWVKVVGHTPGTPGGNKFLKLMSGGGAISANITFGQNYGDGNFFQIGYGDGSSTSNDSQCVARYGGAISGPPSPCSGTVNASSATFDLDDGSWHWFEAYSKLNTDDNYDGALGVWVDGVQKIGATGIRNRNNANSRDYPIMTLINYINEENPPASEYRVYFDKITTADSYIGMPESIPGDLIAPASPSGLSVS